MNNIYFEAVEICPHCMSENTYHMWDVNEKGFVAVCSCCGKEIFLCDECIHAEDGLNENSCGCDWHKTEMRWQVFQRCHQGLNGDCYGNKRYNWNEIRKIDSNQTN